MKLLMVLFAAIAILLAPAAQELDGKIINLKVETKNVAGPVDVAVYLPAGYDAKRAQAYPLIIQLHGGGGSSAAMTGMAETLEAGIKAGLVPASVSVMPSAGRSFYMDYRDGSQKWETFVVADLLAKARSKRGETAETVTRSSRKALGCKLNVTEITPTGGRWQGRRHRRLR